MHNLPVTKTWRVCAFVVALITASPMLAIPVARPEGSHTWGLFESEMQESWNTTVGPALGA
jgi:hypothetical protein